MTIGDMKHRLAVLTGIKPNLTLRLAAELDVIKNHGLKGWTEWLQKKGGRG